MIRDWPKAVELKNGGYYWLWRNEWVHLGRSVEDARPRYNELRRAVGKPANWSHPAIYRAILSKAKDNAKRRGIPFDFSVEELEGLVLRSRHRCSLTAIEFDMDYRPNCSRRPYAPSLDRIESSKGYVSGNVRLVCFAINVALADWGEVVFTRIARRYCYASKRSRIRLDASTMEGA